MKNNIIEHIVVVFVFIIVLIGLLLSYVDADYYSNVYIVEDGFLESLTAIALFCVAVLCFRRAFVLRKTKPPIFILFTIILSLIFIFGAGEEISWGQRIFSFESSDFFEQYNTQEEMNIHNLLILGIKLNIIVFTYLFGLAVAAYILILPYLYKKHDGFKKILDFAGVPIPRLYQTLSLLCLAILTELYPSYIRSSEILEFGSSFLFLLMIVYPYNAEVFMCCDKIAEAVHVPEVKSSTSDVMGELSAPKNESDPLREH